MTITWTNLGGVLEVIVDDVLLSRVLNVENATTISGQSRFLAGGNDVALKNYIGKMGRLNVWDKVEIVFPFCAYVLRICSAHNSEFEHDNEDRPCCSELGIAVFVVCFRLAEDIYCAVFIASYITKLHE